MHTALRHVARRGSRPAWTARHLMGITAPIVTGFIVGSTGSFAIGFLIAGIVLFVGILCYIFLLGEIEPIPPPSAAVEA